MGMKQYDIREYTGGERENAAADGILIAKEARLILRYSARLEETI